MNATLVTLRCHLATTADRHHTEGYPRSQLMAAHLLHATEEVWHRSPREATSMELLVKLHLAEPAPEEETGKGFTSLHQVRPQACLVLLMLAHVANLQPLPALPPNIRHRLS